MIRESGAVEENNAATSEIPYFVCVFIAGGSINNMYALMIARHKLYPQHKKHGMRAIKGQLIMYTSRHVSRF